MFIEDFNPTPRLATEVCPRCNTMGLVVPDSDAYAVAPAMDKQQAAYLMEPSVPARCSACSLVMEWPGCLED